MPTILRRGLAALSTLALLVVVPAGVAASATTVTTWAQLRDAFAAGGEITVGADIAGGPIAASVSSPVTLNLAGHDVTLTGGPAVVILAGAKVTVTDSKGNGALSAIGNHQYSAAIGGPGTQNGVAVPVGALTVSGADVTAKVDFGASAQVVLRGAAVGGGNGADGLAVTILSGSLTATASSWSMAAAIGGGDEGDGGSLTVTRGLVTATNDGYGAAIGGGDYGDGRVVTVNGGTVSATSTGYGAAIGGGNRGTGGSVAVNGGTVSATSDGFGAGIGGGYGGTGGSVAVNGGTVSASADSYGAGIGGGSDGAAGPVIIKGGAVTSTSTGYGAGIGGGYRGDGGVVEVDGGTLTSTGTSRAAGIGGGYQGKGGSVTLRGGTVDTHSGLRASTIGAGEQYPVVVSTTPGLVGTLTVVGTPLAGNANVTAGQYAAAVTSKAPGSEIKYSLTNSAKGAPSEDIRTQITIGHTVSFDADGGLPTPAGQFVVHNGTIAQPSAPTRDGYDFAGWTSGGAKYNFGASVTSALNLTATWTKAAEPNLFVDVSSDPKSPKYSPFHSDIAWMAGSGISRGWHVGGGKYEFRPKEEITRGEMAAFMYRFAGKPGTTTPALSPFTDVSTSHQFYKEITWLSSSGISKGWHVGGGKYEFRPNAEIIREAMAAFLHRYDQL